MTVSWSAWRVWWYAAAWLVVALPSAVVGHGRLAEPPSRASAWRYGFETPHNYNDHELFCGGFARQQRNGGQCGVCGDAWDQPTPRPHEFGGRFGKGVLVRRYVPDSVITIKVELTASHMGYFEFRVCPDFINTTQECLDENILTLFQSDRSEPETTKFFPKDGSKIYEMQYYLPHNFSCDHCMLQWKYIAGNNWGMCENGTGLVGCGPQEEFRACADIYIGDSTKPLPGVPTVRPRPTYIYPTRRPTQKTHTTITPDTTGQEYSSILVGLIIALVMLFITVSVLALLYLYYYRGGQRIKNLLKMQGQSKAMPPPVRPPRQKKIYITHDIRPIETISDYKKNIDRNANIESGFETIKLGHHRI